MPEKVWILKWQDLFPWVTSVTHRLTSRDSGAHTVAVVRTTVTVGIWQEVGVSRLTRSENADKALSDSTTILLRRIYARMVRTGRTFSIENKGKVLVAPTEEEIEYAKATN